MNDEEIKKKVKKLKQLLDKTFNNTPENTKIIVTGKGKVYVHTNDRKMAKELSKELSDFNRFCETNKNDFIVLKPEEINKEIIRGIAVTDGKRFYALNEKTRTLIEIDEEKYKTLLVSGRTWLDVNGKKINILSDKCEDTELDIEEELELRYFRGEKYEGREK